MSKVYAHYTYAMVLVASVAIIDAYSDGGIGILEACSHMTPGHGYLPQTSPAPYQIVLEKNSYSHGSTVTVTINSTSGATFRGFMIQMRTDVNDATSVVPGFALPLVPAALISCESREKSAVVHNENSYKGNISVKWTPTVDAVINVTAVVTIVHNETTYWTKLTSQIIEISGPLDRSTAATLTSVYTITFAVYILVKVLQSS